ncbi:transferase family-domain-containing protein [Chaetomium sp. MPI-SDFR-AT-0129]|nr:transferase family-domain-containing protein [Chaetomium sp. MPI-SDFR-AT-0129]
MSPPAHLDLAPVTARYQLQCANPDALAGLESPFQLGPLDQIVFRSVPIQVVFVYKMPTSGLQDKELIPVDRLRQALCRLLDYYPHLTGRLHFDPGSNAPEIRLLGAGAELLEAHSHEQFADFASRSTSGRILVTNLPGSGNDLLTPFDPTTEGVCRDPIFTVKHTRFACGGVALGVYLNHIVCDAQGFFNLVNDLAELYRGLRSSSHPALIQPPEIRSILRDPQALSPGQRQAALRYQTTAFFTEDDPRLEEASAGFEDTPPSANFEVVGRVLRFSGHDLAALKAQASDPSGQGWVSTTEALSAYLCQKVYRARLKFLQSQGMLPAVASKMFPGFWISIDMRGSERLNLPPKYFPNCIYPPYTNSLHPSIADCPLWEVARSVHDLIRDVDPERMRMTTQWIAAQPDKSRIRVGFLFGKGSFTVTQWCKMNMYEGNDLDIAANGEPIRPALVAPPFTPISLVDGLAVLLGTNEPIYQSSEQARPSPIPSIDVNLSFIKPLWDIFDADEEFRKFYC